ncbi:MAG: terpene cyclase/mutase family protein [Anaerolineales bacterium]|nr:terpene cyclase/mutase family protein [Anaerolineales bacterium]
MQSKHYRFPNLTLIALVIFAGLFPAGKALAHDNTQNTDPIFSAALAYLQTQQGEDGGINSFGSGSDPDGTARTLIALAANGQALDLLVSESGATLLDYLSAQAVPYTHDGSGLLFPSRAGLLLAAAVKAEANPMDFGGMDLVAELEAAYHAETGDYSTAAVQDWSSGLPSELNQAWSILGLSLAGRTIPAPATDYLVNAQSEDGSWGAGDPDITALVVVALSASGNLQPGNPAIQSALLFFRSSQLPSGGWRPAWDTDPLNADTTGWVIQALLAAGEEPATWAAAEGDPYTALSGLQKEDGSIGGTYANAYSTADALIGLSRQPIAPAPPAEEALNHAGLVVQFADGSAYLACIPFTASSLTGLELLQQSNLTIESVVDPSLGTAVCKINDTGCDPEACFCDMPNYWAYWRLVDGEWGYATTGAGQNPVQAGEVDGWSYSEGMSPLAISYAEICSAEMSGASEVIDTWLPPVEASPAAPTPSPEPTETLAATDAPAEPTQPEAPPATTGAGTSGSGGISYVWFIGLAVILVVVLILVYLRARSRG